MWHLLYDKKFIVGDNMLTGHSYVEHIIGKGELVAYYDAKHLYETYWQIEEAGYNCMFPYGSALNIQTIYEYKKDVRETPDTIKEKIKGVYRDVFSQIKENDIACIGVNNIQNEQIKTDAELFDEVMQEMENENK